LEFTVADKRRTVASAPLTEVDSIHAESRISTPGDPIAPGTGPTTSVLICDDRPTVGLELSSTFRTFLPSIAPVNASVVADGFALVDAFEKTQAGLVLIAIHADTTAGIDAINLLLGLHPRANTVVYGSVTDVELLAAAYARGAGGLLVWEPSSPGRATRPPERTAPGCAAQKPRPGRSHRR